MILISPRKRTVDIVLSYVLALIVFVFSVLAIFNLVCCIAVIRSLIWLLIVAYSLLFEYGKYIGIRMALKSALKELSVHHYIELEAGKVRVGFYFLSLRIVYLDIELEQVQGILWDGMIWSGPHYDQMLREYGANFKNHLPEWRVCLNYDDGKGTQNRNSENMTETCWVSPGCNRKAIVDYGQQVVAMFNKAGVRLVPEKDDDCHYVRVC